MALHEVSVPKSLDYSSLAEVTNLRKEFGYMLKYLTCLKHYVMADIMGEARLDKKTKEILKRLNEYIYEPQDRFVARTNEKLRSSWRPEEAAKRAQERAKEYTLDKLRHHILEMHIRLYDLSKGLENNTYVDPRLTNSFRELRDELKDLYHYSKLDRIFEEKAETQAKIMEKLRKGAADAKIALYQLEGLRAALKRTGAKAEDLREETEIAVRAGAEAKKESIVNMLKKLMPVILIVGFAFFFVGGILSTEPTGNFVGTPALNIFTAIFSLILLLTGAVFFRKSSLR